MKKPVGEDIEKLNTLVESLTQTIQLHYIMESTQSTHEVRMYAEPGDIRSPVASFDIDLSTFSSKCDAFCQASLLYHKLMYGTGKQI